MVVFGCRLFCLMSADVNLATFMWDEGCDRREVHQCVVFRVEAVVQAYEALGRALHHAVVAGYQEVDVTPEAGPLQLRNQQANVVVNLMEYNRQAKNRFHR